MRPALSIEKDIEVGFSDVDAMQIVWHGNYVRYFEIAREHFGNKYGIGYMDFFHKGFLTPLVDLQISYKKMVAYGEHLRVNVRYEQNDTVKIVFHYKIYNQDEELVCTGKTTQVITTMEKRLVLKNPDLKEAFERKWLTKTEKNGNYIQHHI